MTASSPASRWPSRASAAYALDRECDRFEAAWKAAREVGRPAPEDYLPPPGDPGRVGLLRELLALDRHYRRLAGDDPRPDDYAARFPEFAAELGADPNATPGYPAEPPPRVELPAAGPADALAEAALADQRRRWAGGEPVPVERYLAAWPGEVPVSIALELILAECGLRGRAGGRPTPAEYRRRFPALAGLIRDDLEATAATLDFEPAAAAGDETLTIGPAQKADGPRPTVPGYQVGRLLGHGGMGAVYLARQVRFDRDVALKVILSGSQARPEELARFRNEVQAVGRLDHANVVQVFDAGDWRPEVGPPAPYLAMELCTGGSLSGLLTGEPLPPARAAELVRQVADGVQHAHDQGIVHRDLKPGNVLLAADGTPKVTDFGLAKWGDGEMTASGAVMGTPSYMAPEQAAGKARHVGPAADVWALGVVLYELLTGRRPFAGSSVAETMALVQVAEPVAPRRLTPGCPRDLETVCLKCLEKGPHKRYGSAGELADDLRRFLDGRPVSARPVGRPERAWRWARRHPSQAGLYAVSAAAAIVLLAGGLWFSNELGAEAARREADRIAKDREVAEQRRLTQTQEFFRTLSEVRARRARPAPGWTLKNLDALRAAAALPDAAGQLPELRTEAAAALAAHDVLPRGVVGEGVTPLCVAWDPLDRWVALGPRTNNISLTTNIPLIDPRRPERSRRLTVPSRPLFEKGKGLVPNHVSAVAFGPDGRWFVAGLKGGAAYRWDLSEPDPKAAPVVELGRPVERLAFSPDGKFLAVGPRPLVTVDAAAWREAARLDGAEDFAFHPREGWLVAKDLTSAPRSPATLAPIRPGSDTLFRPRFTPAGFQVGVHKELVWFDPASRLAVKHFRNRDGGVSLDSEIDDLAPSPDNALLLASSGSSHAGRLWDCADGRPVADVSVPDGDCRAAWSPDGRAFVLTGKDRTHLFEAAGRTVLTATAWHPRPVAGFAVRPADGAVVCLSPDERDIGGADVTYWPGAAPHALVPAGRPSRFEYPVGLAAPLAIQGDCLVCPLPGPKELHTQEALGRAPARILGEVGGVTGLSAGPDGRVWVVFGEHLRAWDSAGTKPSAWWDNSLGMALTGRPTLTCVAAGAELVAAGGKDGTVRFFEPGRGQLQPRRTVTLDGPAVSAVAVWGDSAVAGTEGGALALVRPDGEAWRAEAGDRVESADWHGELVASAGRDGDVRLWRVAGRELSHLLTLPHGRPVRKVAFAAGGTRLYALVAGESAVRVWHLDRLWRSLGDLELSGDLPPLTTAAPPAPPGPVAPAKAGPLTVEWFQGLDWRHPAGVEAAGSVSIKPRFAAEVGLAGQPISGRFQGRLKAPDPGSYTLSARTSGESAVRVWLDGRLVMDLPLADRAEVISTNVDFPDGPYEFRCDVAAVPQAEVRLMWARHANRKRGFSPIAAKDFVE